MPTDAVLRELACLTLASVCAAACTAPDEPELDEQDGELAAVVDGLPGNGEGSGHPLTFHGGFVQVHPKVYLVFWGPKWTSDASHQRVVAKVQDTFRALAGSHYNNLLTQYNQNATLYVNNDVELKGTGFDNSPPLSNLSLGIDVSPVKTEIPDAALRAIDANHWPIDVQNTQVIVFPQQGSTYLTLFGAAFCGAHSYFPGRGGFAVGVVKWAPDFGCHPANSLEEDIAWTAVHEYAEMATDPDIHATAVPYPRADANGWHTDEGTLTPPPAPHEVTDLCENWTVSSTAGNSNERLPIYDTVFPGGKRYWLPMQWSNATSQCENHKGQEFLSPDTIAPFNQKHTVQEPILAKYTAMGGPGGLLGPPAFEEVRLSDGAVSYFSGQVCAGGFPFQGRATGSGIYYERSSGGVHEVHGCIYQKYNSVLGPSGELGMPITDETAVADGRVSHFRGVPCPGGGALNPGGAGIYFTGPTWSHIVKGCNYNTYARAGGPSFLGFPITDETDIAGGRVNYFSGQVCSGGGPVFENLPSGSGIYYTPGTGSHEVHGCIYQKYTSKGGPFTLGFPITDETDVPNGRVSYFSGAPRCNGTSGPFGSGSAVYYTNINGIGAHSVQGCIYPHYINVHSGPGGHLGFPTSDEQEIAGGWVSYFDGHLCDTRGPEHSGSAIFASAATGVHAVQGCIYKKYWDPDPLGPGPGGHLGFPVSDEEPIAGGAVSYFYGNACGNRGAHGEGSAIYAGAGGIHYVQGCIYRAYSLPTWQAGHGGPGGHLGWPVTDEIALPGGWVSYFQGNACPNVPLQLYNSGSAIFASGSHVHAVQGCIYTKYMRDHGGATGSLGFPVTEEMPIAGGGWASYFSGQFCGPEPGPGGSGSGIFATGDMVHTVKGCIFTAYLRDHGGPGGHLGFPTTDEIALPFGAVSYFAGNGCGAWTGPNRSGSAIYAGPGGIHNVQGCIYKKYIELGGPLAAGGFGYPTSNEIAGPNGWISYFEHGYIFADGTSVQGFHY